MESLAWSVLALLFLTQMITGGIVYLLGNRLISVFERFLEDRVPCSDKIDILSRQHDSHKKHTINVESTVNKLRAAMSRKHLIDEEEEAS